MASTIKIKRSNVAGKNPTANNIVEGELALNTADKKLFSRGGDSIFEVGANVSSLSIGGTEVVNSSGSWVGSTTGLKGEPGTNGSNGTDGTKGQKGEAGTNGTNGTNGSDGAKGDAGADGAK